MTYRSNALKVMAAGALSMLLASCGAATDDTAANDKADAQASEEVLTPDAPSTPQPLRDKAALREKAKTDPDGADAEAVDTMGRNELIATAINSAGYLCARVTDMYPSNGTIIVHCVENRNGSGRVKYSVNASAGTVEQL